MSREALRCIRCAKELRNVTDDSDNQPNDGLAFESYGHYGSTVFDPMDGTALEINVCDDCLIICTHEGRVAWSRRYKPILCDGVIVGREWVDRPLVPWNPSAERTTEPTDNDQSHVEPDEVGREDARIEWRGDWPTLVKLIRTSREQATVHA